MTAGDAEAAAGRRRVPRIRAARPAELDPIAALKRRAYASYLPLLGRPAAPATEDYRPWLAREALWVAELDDTLVGAIAVERHAAHDEIYSVAVEPHRQGLGIGRALIGFVEHRAREAGHGEMRLYTNARMHGNIAFYARLGYREVGRRAKPGRPEITLVDMARRLDPPRDGPPG